MINHQHQLIAMSHFFLLLLTLILFPLHTSSQNTGKIDVGASITAAPNSKPYLSLSGDFAFGFLPLQTDTNHFVLSVWFAKIPTKTIVWFDRHLAPRGSILKLKADNGLVLGDTHNNVLYNYTSNLAGQVAYAFMNDTGNFVLSGSNSALLWQSFQNPSDTILPTQTIELNGPQLVSKHRELDFSYGRFYAGMSTDGNFVLNTKSIFSNLDFDDEYYNSQIKSGNLVLFDQSQAKISVIDSNGQPITNILSSNLSTPSDYYFRATLEFDGVFSLYYHPKKIDSNSKWAAAGTLPDNICMDINGQKGSGACGFNNVCNIDSSTKRPVCSCPEGYLLVDPNDRYGDCKSNFTENCVDQGGKGEYGLVVVQDVDWPFNDYEQRYKSTLEDCKSACYDDYFCRAAIFRSESCWKKRLPLSNGRVDKSLKATAFLKVRIS